MSNVPIERLLQPSLSASEPPARAPYSSTVLFLCAVFGGALALILCFGVNIHRLRRWRRDAAFLALLVVLLTVAILAPYTPQGAPLLAWIREFLGGTRTWGTLCIMLAALAAMQRHARERRAAELMGLRIKNVFLHGLGFVAVGQGVTYLLIMALKGML